MTADRRFLRTRIIRLSLALLLICSVASSLGFLNAQEKQDEKKDAADKDKKKDLPLEADRTIAFDTERRILDLARRGAGRKADRLRVAGGPLHAADGRRARRRGSWPGNMFDTQPRFSPDGSKHRVPLRPQRRREHLGREPRRQRSESDHQGQERLVTGRPNGRPTASTSSSRSRRRASRRHAAVALPRGWRQRRQSHRQARSGGSSIRSARRSAKTIASSTSPSAPRPAVSTTR